MEFFQKKRDRNAVRYKALFFTVLFVCVLLACPAYCGEQPVQVSTASVAVARYDTSKVQLREPTDALARYHSDSDFVYERNTATPPTAWEQFKAWLWSLLQKLLPEDPDTAATVWNIAVYVFIAIGALLVLFRISGMTFTGAFGRAARRASISAELIDENIHEMDFDALIEEAAKKELYRKAVRLLYLRTLKELTDNHCILWRPEKTNREYARELTAADMRKAFERLTLLFECIWYGDFPIDRPLFEQARTLFANFSTTVVERV